MKLTEEQIAGATKAIRKAQAEDADVYLNALIRIYLILGGPNRPAYEKLDEIYQILKPILLPNTKAEKDK